MSRIDRINILDSVVDLISVDQLHAFIKNSIDTNNKNIVSHINVHGCNLAIKYKWYSRLIKKSPIVFCDGKGIQLGLWLLGYPVPDHITYHTWIWQLLEFCSANNYSLYFLGSKDGVGQRAINRIKEKYSSLQINSHHGYFKKEGAENIRVINKINELNPDIVIVGFGMPIQERWIYENYKNINSKIFLSGGAYLEWISGNKKQCPSLLTKIGLEWLYRLIIEPRRLFSRYIIGNTLFIIRILQFKVNLTLGKIDE